MLTLQNLYRSNIVFMAFTDWLDNELNKRHWNRAELARQINMTEPALSHIYSDDPKSKRKPGVDMCRAIAKAFGMPPEMVFRQAGLLPSIEADTSQYEELKHWFSQMSEDERDLFLQQGRLLIEHRNRTKPKRKRQQQDDPAMG